MAAKLDALDAEYDDGITLADIKTWYTAEVAAVPEFPSAFLLGENTQVTGEGGGWMAPAHEITVAFLVADAEPQTLRTRLYRYIRATTELLVTARTAIGWEYGVNFQRIDFSPMFSNAGAFLSDARLVVSLKKYEST